MLVLTLAAPTACTIRDQAFSDPAGPAPPPPDFHALRAAAKAELGLAVLLKPADAPDGAVVTSLAPLIVQDIGPSAAGYRIEGAQRPGRVVRNAAGEIAVEDAVPTVYTDTGAVNVRGRTYDQVTFVWWYPNSAGMNDMKARGVRMTLGDDGFPLVWEVLGAGRAHLLYVSATLERLAREQYGPPLVGRAFSAELSMEEARYSAVLQVIEDGPIPLGPYVYVTGRERLITALHCRCSPAQFDRARETDLYELVPMTELPSSLRGVSRESDDLTRHLRWPAGL